MDMKKKAYIVAGMAFVAFWIIFIKYKVGHKDSRKVQDETISYSQEFIPCMEIPEGQTVTITYPAIAAAGKTERITYTNETLHEQYTNLLEKGPLNLRKVLRESPEIKVNYECTKITCQINCDTDMSYVASIYNYVAGFCECIQLLSGVEYSDLELELILIYEPGGEVAFKFTDFSNILSIVTSSQGRALCFDTLGKDVLITEESWNQRMEELKEK